MPTVVNERTNRVELPNYYEWSWPDHPAEMTDTDARIRCARGLTEGATPDAPLKETDLAKAYGKLLADEEARIQRRTHTGDNLPRDKHGALLEVKQQMAAEIAERRNALKPGAYETAPVFASREPGPLPNRYGAVDGRELATWLPSEERPDRAIKAVRYNDAAQSSLSATHIASCVGENLEDNGKIWREAIKRGREVNGLPSALLTAAGRAPDNVHVERSKDTREYSISIERNQVTVNAPLPKGNHRADACEELYAKARGTIAAAYGEPQNETEHALDALAASIVTSRGTNGAGLGWAPPEPERLRAAGVELQRDPSRLAELCDHVNTLEHVFYPPWPGREMARSAEHVQEKKEEDIFDDRRQAYAERLVQWGDEQDERSRRIIREPPARLPTDARTPARNPNDAPQREHERAEHSSPSR